MVHLVDNVRPQNTLSLPVPHENKDRSDLLHGGLVCELGRCKLLTASQEALFNGQTLALSRKC